MSKLNMRSIKNKVENSTKFKAVSKTKAQRVLKEIKKEALDEFNKHPVTKEVEAGTSASNSTGTLGGYGNLFTFMGFESSDTPVERARKLFSASIQLQKVSKNTYKITMPNEETFASETMPWESGRSWLGAVEQGISNFSYYMYKKFGAGRSGKAFQAKHLVRSVTFMPIKYMSEIMNNTIKKMGSITKKK